MSGKCMDNSDKWLSVLVCLYTLIASSAFGYLSKPTEMGLAIVAGAIMMAFVNIDKIKRFKGAGFEAEMKEIQKVVNDAYVTIDNLKKVADPLIQCTAHQLTWGNRLSGGMEEKEAQEIFKQLDDICISLALNSKKYAVIKDQYNKLHGFDRLRIIIDQLRKIPQIDQNIVSEIEAARNMALPLPSRSDIQKILQPIDKTLPPELSKAIDEYENYVENKIILKDIITP